MRVSDVPALLSSGMLMACLLLRRAGSASAIAVASGPASSGRRLPSTSTTRSSAEIDGRKSARFSPSAIGRWQAAGCSGPSPRRGSSGGSSLTQTGAALGHRGWNRQPDGGAMGEGTSPARMICFRWSD